LESHQTTCHPFQVATIAITSSGKRNATLLLTSKILADVFYELRVCQRVHRIRPQRRKHCSMGRIETATCEKTRPSLEPLHRETPFNSLGHALHEPAAAELRLNTAPSTARFSFGWFRETTANPPPFSSGKHTSKRDCSRQLHDGWYYRTNLQRYHECSFLAHELHWGSNHPQCSCTRQLRTEVRTHTHTH
jgi:hypothetical protein